MKTQKENGIKTPEGRKTGRNQGEGPQKKEVLPTLRSWTYSFQNCEKILNLFMQIFPFVARYYVAELENQYVTQSLRILTSYYRQNL